MSDEELQLLITLDDPVEAPEKDTFHHLQTKNNLEYWLSQQFPTWRRLTQAEDVSTSDASRVTFGEGEWTCTLSRLSGAANDFVKGMNIELCTVTHRKNGEIVEQKVFYDFAGTQTPISVM
jgi:hypothetical protein